LFFDSSHSINRDAPRSRKAFACVISASEEKALDCLPANPS
jgi:hypothetical protein